MSGTRKASLCFCQNDLSLRMRGEEVEEKNCEMKSLAAYQRIRDMVITREKLPGTRLVISELEEELGIGKGPIRKR